MKSLVLLAALGLFTNVVLGARYFAFKLSFDEYQQIKRYLPGLQRKDLGVSLEQRQYFNRITRGEVRFDPLNYFRADNNFDLNRMLSIWRSLGLDRRFIGEFTTSSTPPGFFSPSRPKRRSDPNFKDEWWVKELKVIEAWDYAMGRGVRIADCDAGYYINEPDLRDNLLLDYMRDFADDDQPRVVNDGRFVSHGTAVVALMTGIRNNKGVNGIAPRAKTIPLQNFNYDSRIDDIEKELATMRCVLGAITIPGVKIIVLENQTAKGSSETFPGTRDAVRLAIEAGITVVSAAGNSNVELLTEKKFDTGSIIVGALEKDSSKASFSNYGERITVAGFGRDLLTLAGPDGRLAKFGGTSGATPQVAATIALMLEVNRNLTPEQNRLILEATSSKTKKNATVGGRLQMIEAIKMAKELKGRHEGMARLKEWQRKSIVNVLRFY